MDSISMEATNLSQKRLPPPCCAKDLGTTMLPTCDVDDISVQGTFDASGLSNLPCGELGTSGACADRARRDKRRLYAGDVAYQAARQPCEPAPVFSHPLDAMTAENMALLFPSGAICFKERVRLEETIGRVR
jgi:hypothetical protein